LEQTEEKLAAWRVELEVAGSILEAAKGKAARVAQESLVREGAARGALKRELAPWNESVRGVEESCLEALEKVRKLKEDLEDEGLRFESERDFVVRLAGRAAKVIGKLEEFRGKELTAVKKGFESL